MPIRMHKYYDCKIKENIAQLLLFEATLSTQVF